MNGMDSAVFCNMPLWKCRVQVPRGHTAAPVGCLHRDYGARVAEAYEANGLGWSFRSRHGRRRRHQLVTPLPPDAG